MEFVHRVVGSPYRLLLARSRDRKNLKGSGMRVFVHQRKSQKDLKMLNACKILYKEKLIERFGFNDVSAKPRNRINGKWIIATQETILKQAEKDEGILKALVHIFE